MPQKCGSFRVEMTGWRDSDRVTRPVIEVADYCDIDRWSRLHINPGLELTPQCVIERDWDRKGKILNI